ncbi:treslin-like [Dendronephthya gigantea]|uniref:treslin-like n=1 Tax=Dendronephthya gigantea TaxID=151771 RepID=UPI00106B4C01|nr:treslin-like [Dendronephthya gigantea]
MAAKFEQGGNFQIVFLVDVCVKEHNICNEHLEDVHSIKLRGISRCVLRLLLHFDSVLKSGNSTPLKWGFKFYNSSVLNFEYKRSRFHELSSESFEQFEAELRTRFKSARDGQSSTAGVTSLSCCVKEILQDFPWVTPDISSPSRTAKNEPIFGHNQKSRNYLFVIADCPLSDTDLGQFLSRDDNSYDAQTVFNEIFSAALYEEFYNKCGLSLFWIDSGLWCLAPEKLKQQIEDWRGHSLMSSVTKQLNGNIIPISMLQNGENICNLALENGTSTPKGFENRVKTLAEVQVMAAVFKCSFGKIVQAFLGGKDFICKRVVNDVRSLANGTNGLLSGICYFRERRVCSVILSYILQNKLTSHHKHITNEMCEKTVSDQNSRVAPDSEKALNVVFTTKTNNETNTEVQCVENCFVIKGVLASSDVSASWMNPTMLYSCFSGENWNKNENDSFKAPLFHQMLALTSHKSLCMVLEYLEPTLGTLVTGILQPVTTLCAILSTIEKDKLLLVEKAMLRHRSRCGMLPFELQEGEKVDDDFGKDNGGCMLAEEKGGKTSVIDSYICGFQKRNLKERGQGIGLRKKLKDYYSRKKSELNSEKHVELQAMTRGRLCQETASQRIKAAQINETSSQNNKLESTMKTDDPTEVTSNFDSEKMDEDLPDLSGIKSIDDLKANLEEGYKKCLQEEQSLTVYTSRVFQMIEHFKRAGQLKDLQEIDAILKSSVLRDAKNLREFSESEESELYKEKIVLEYKLQVFLRLEFADKFGVEDEEKAADEVTSMLRAISFQKDPAYLSSFLKKSIIPRYAGNLSSLLCLVYDHGLMQRPPNEILSPSQVTSDEETPLKSRKDLSSSKKAESVEEMHSESSQSSRVMVRRNSVMAVPAKRREIVIPMKGKADKGRRKANSAGKRSGKKRSSSGKKPVTPVKKVRRNLFVGNERRSSPRKNSKASSSTSERGNLTRRHTISAFSSKEKVADTPVCKQVSQRMLRRQEWARRRTKTVTDVTVVEESPDKDHAILPRRSPRLKTATFYSASQTALSTTTMKSSDKLTQSTSADVASGAENRSGRTLHRARSMNSKLDLASISSPGKKFTRTLSINESSSSKLAKEDSFAEVFLQTDDKNEGTILSVCSPDKQQDSTSSRNVLTVDSKDSCDDPKLPLSTTEKHNISTDSPSKRTSPSFTSVHLKRSLSRRSNSSPSLSTTPPLKPSKSPLINHKSFPTTSPVLFKTPRKTPKSSPVNFSPDQIFDISIPLTPVKSSHIKPRKTDTAKDSKKTLDTVTRSPSECVDPTSERVNDLTTITRNSETVGESSESVVNASPVFSRKRSLISSAKSFRSKTSLNFESCSTIVDMGDSDVTTNDVIDQLDKSVPFVQTEVFKSPVTTKRKKTALVGTGRISPLNQILKQRKNHRNTSPAGTPRGELNKLEVDTSSVNSCKENEQTSNRKAIKRKIISDDSNIEGTTDNKQPSSFITEDDLSPNKIILTSSSHEKKTTKFLASPCNLRPHFTPMSLSADSLKHLQESPVLLGTSPKATDIRTRKWSERKSPLTASQTSLRKRLRHDS